MALYLHNVYLPLEVIGQTIAEESVDGHLRRYAGARGSSRPTRGQA